MQNRSSTVSWILAVALHAILLVWCAYAFDPTPPRPKPERLLAKTIILDQEIIAMGEVLQAEEASTPAPPKVEKMAEEQVMVPKPEPAQPAKKELDEPQPSAPEPEPDVESLPNPAPEPEPVIPTEPEKGTAAEEPEPEPVKKAPPEPKPELKKPEAKPAKPKPKPATPKEKPKPKPKAPPPTKAKPKKTEEKPKTKPKPAPKPKPKPDCKPKPKPVAKNLPKKESPPPVEDKKPVINEKQMELLAKARQSASKLESADVRKASGQVVKPKKLGVLNIENAGPPEYQRALASKLRSLLTLPEFGDVKLKLTLSRNGKVVKIEILSAKSKLNQSYVEQNLKGATLPAFGDNFAGSNQETFTLTLKNE